MSEDKKQKTDQVAVPRDVMQQLRALKLRLADIGKRITLQKLVEDALTIYVETKNKEMDK